MPDADHDDSRNLTILDLRGAAEAAGISVQQAAANIVACVGPAPVEIEEDPDPVLKALAVESPQRFVLGVAYRAEEVDGHGEYMTAAELERAAWDYAKNGRRIGFFHAGGTDSGHADVVESYIWRGDPWVTTDMDGAEQVIKAGDWVLGAILDEPGFNLVTSRKADGWSVDGMARRRKTPRPQRR